MIDFLKSDDIWVDLQKLSHHERRSLWPATFLGVLEEVQRSDGHLSPNGPPILRDSFPLRETPILSHSPGLSNSQLSPVLPTFRRTSSSDRRKYTGRL